LGNIACLLGVFRSMKSPRAEAYFLLVAADVDSRRLSMPSAYEVALHRLKKRLWGLKEHTRNRKQLRPGDELAIYAAGKRNFGGCFVASAKVATASQLCASGKRAAIDSPDLHHARIVSDYFIELTCIKIFSVPVPIRNIKHKLQFIKQPDSPYWAAPLQNGSAKISQKDYSLICKLSAQS
jgi:hypothetical protein